MILGIIFCSLARWRRIEKELLKLSDSRWSSKTRDSAGEQVRMHKQGSLNIPVLFSIAFHEPLTLRLEVASDIIRAKAAFVVPPSGGYDRAG